MICRAAMLLLTLASIAVSVSADEPLPQRPEDVTPNATEAFVLGPYDYDAAGNIKAIGIDKFAYDAFGRVIYGGAGIGRQEEYTYDRFGNLLTIRTDGGPERPLGVDSGTNRLTANGSTTATYDNPTGQLTGYLGGSFEYDAAEMIKRSTIDGATKVYVYSASDERLVSVSVINTAGTHAETKSEWTLRDASGLVLRRLERTGAGLNWRQDYIYRGGQLLASELSAAPFRQHYHSDHLGSPRLITDGAGNEISRHTYYPFGTEATPRNPNGDRLKFTGHERDFYAGPGTDVDYMHARYYKPVWGRFLSVDPVLDVKRALKEPQAWNRYSYVVNNPINRIDPDGRVDQNWDGGAARQLFPDDRAAQLEFDQRVAKGTAIGAGVSLGIMGVVACGPSCWKAAAVAAWNWAQRNPGAVQQGMQAAANLAAPPGVSPIPVSAGNLKHIGQHLGAFQKLDSKMTLDGVVKLGRTIASNADNLVGTPGGRKVFEAVVKIGDQNVTVRAVLNTEGGLRSVHIRY